LALIDKGVRTFQRLPLWAKITLVSISVCLLARSLPLFMPISIQDFALGSEAVEFSDRHGYELGTLLSRDREHRVTVPLERVSPLFQQAIIAAEDRNFYNHGALDLAAIARATFTSMQAQKIVSGASTITMQLARMRDRSPANFGGKLQEIWTAWRIVAGMSKPQILQTYINYLPMGGNIYGVEAASRIYFGVSAQELNLNQASLLAALPNDPTYLNPYQNLQELRQRQSYVLERMLADRYISLPERDITKSENLVLQPRSPGIMAAPHFLFWLAQQLPKNHGAKVNTTIDAGVQQFVQAQVSQISENLKVSHGAALVIDLASDQVLAYVGSPDYFASEGENDGIQALRQPGSTLKPFLYQMALEQDLIRPNSILADTPIHYALPGAMLYSPTDFSGKFQGSVRVRLALANSLNIPAVRLLEKIGVDHFLERLQLLGFNDLTKTAEHYGLGLTLGSGEVSLWQLARAYSAIANQGKLSTATISPELPLQKTIEVGKNRVTWQWITDVLSDRFARAITFGPDSVLNLPFSAAVKTGTSSNFRDTWTVGFSHDFLVATWVGNFDGSPMQQVSGSTGAAPLWQRIMLRLHQNRAPLPFPSLQGMKPYPICADTGQKPTSTCKAIAQEYFSIADLISYEPKVINEQKKLNSNCQILTPSDRDLYVKGTQKLAWQVGTFQTNNQRENLSVQWFLNGKKTGIGPKYFWQMQPGNWSLMAKCGDSSEDQVQFEVIGDMELEQSKRSGFSVVNKR
jgi:penicillin-binding protein 1C